MEEDAVGLLENIVIVDNQTTGSYTVNVFEPRIDVVSLEKDGDGEKIKKIFNKNKFLKKYVKFVENYVAANNAEYKRTLPDHLQKKDKFSSNNNSPYLEL